MKPDIIRLWNFPKEMKDFTVDRDKDMIAFSGSHFRLPLLLRVSDKRVEPLPESEYSAPLRFQLANFAPRDNFVWVDRCYKMAQLWAPEPGALHRLVRFTRATGRATKRPARR